MGELALIWLAFWASVGAFLFGVVLGVLTCRAWIATAADDEGDPDPADWWKK